MYGPDQRHRHRDQRDLSILDAFGQLHDAARELHDWGTRRARRGQCADRV